MAKKKKAVPPPEPPRRDDELQGDEQYEEGMFRADEPAPQRTRSPSPEPKIESPPQIPIQGLSSPVPSSIHDEDDTSFDTRAWARNIPYGLSPPHIAPSSRGSPAHPAYMGALGTSPPGPAFSLAGSPSAVADRYRSPVNEDLRGGFSSPSPGLPPRAGFPIPNKPRGDGQLSMSPKGRPLSMPTNYTPPNASVPRPQAHLRQISEADIGLLHSRSTSSMREGKNLVVFDQAFYDGNVGDVVLHSSGRSLYIYKLERDKLTILGTLSRLRGTVIAAKMLPASDSKVIEPMVVLIIHGPALVPTEDPSHPTISQTEAQTSVEVYAIKASRHVATLYRTNIASIINAKGLTSATHAIGALTIHVANRFITVTSGTSGEVYIFESRRDDPTAFHCLGKLWTSMPDNRQRSYSVSSASSGATGQDESPIPQAIQENGIVALSHRWLAFVPPAASSQTSLHGEIGVPFSSHKEPPGLMAHASPAQPSPNCEAETPLEDSFIGKVTRNGVQEASKGARWAAEKGFNAVRSYWDKPNAQSSSDPNAYNPSYGQQASFPPTHAQDNGGRAKTTTACVSVVDLERLSESNSIRPDTMIHPIATFPIRDGCRFLSFSPTGLGLFTTNARGDVSFVWCLMRMIHGNIATVQGDVAASDSHASVRQVARYGRLTESSVVDVVWTKPRGEKLAILTERGTIHIHDLPASSFRWPPPMYHATAESRSTAGSEVSSQKSQAIGSLGNVWGWASSQAQTIQAAAKNRPSFNGATFGGVAYTVGAKGSRMVSAGISKSVDFATAVTSNVMHSGENRTRLPGGHKARVAAGTVSLLSSKYQDALAVAGGGLIHLHAIRLSTTDGGKGKRSVAGERISHLNVPSAESQEGPVSAFDGTSPVGRWFADVQSHGFRPNEPQPQPLSYAEIETSTPYRPFHNDHRVSMNTYADDGIFDKEAKEDWEFGEDFDIIEVGEDELPSGSMNLGQSEIETAADRQSDVLDFQDNSAPEIAIPPPAVKSGKSGKRKKARPIEPKHEELIGIDDEDEGAAFPAQSRGGGEAFGDGFEDEGLAFGQRSDFEF